MKEYQKDFVGWARVAEEVEKRKRPETVKAGAIYWCNLGVNVGSIENGKGPRFTRPVLLLAQFNQNLVWVVPISTRTEWEGTNYVSIMVNGMEERLIVEQLRLVDVRCIEKFIDEVDSNTLLRFKKIVLGVLRAHFYKKLGSSDECQNPPEE